MNNKSAVNFINSLVRNLQVLCHSNVDFSDNVEVIGHIYLSVDKSTKFNYIVNEKVCKSDNSSTVFVSNSFHAEQGEKDKSESDPKQGDQSNSGASSNTDKAYSPHKHMKKNLPGQTDFRNIHRADRPKHALDDRESEPFKKFRRDEPALDRVKEEPETFTAVPVYFQPSASDRGYNESNSERYSDGTRTRNDSYSEFSQTPQSSQHIDLTNIKEEPDDVVYSDNSNIHNILNQAEMQSSQFEQVHNTNIDNLQHLSNSLTSYSDMTGASPTTAEQQQQILSLLSARRRVELSLEDKVKLINMAETQPNLSQRALCKQFNCSQSTVCLVLKRREEYKAEFINRQDMKS